MLEAYQVIRKLFITDGISRQTAEELLMDDIGYTDKQASRAVHGWELEAGI
jgi:hypothetical protein